MNFLLVLIFALLYQSSTGERKRYDGYQVIEVIPNSDRHVELVKQVSEIAGVEPYDSVHGAGYPVELLLSPQQISVVQGIFQGGQLPYKVLREDVQKFFDSEFERLDARQTYDPNDFNTYEEIVAEINRLASVCPPGFSCEVYSIGQSLEGRDLVTIYISRLGQVRSAVWIDTLIHCREWIAGTTSMRVLAKLIEEYATDESARNLMDTYDFYFLPVFNPDGYVFAWEEDRMWRKNRQPPVETDCWGVDLNRNHDFEFIGLGSSTDECSPTYRGPFPSSEPEIQVVEAELARVAPSLRMLLSIHTAAQAWLIPYGHLTDLRCTFVDDHDDLQRAADVAGDAVAAAEGAPRWRVGNTCDVLYFTNGITCDYAYGALGVKYSYSPELRGPGFAPGPETIEPAFNELYAGLVAILPEIELIESGQ